MATTTMTPKKAEKEPVPDKPRIDPRDLLVKYGFIAVTVMFFLYFGLIFKEIAIRAVAMGMGEKFSTIHEYLATDNANVFNNEFVTMYIAAVVIKIMLWLTHLFIISTAIAYWLSSRTKAYFLLRKEVDGDEVEEMYLEEEEEAFEMAEPAAPAAVAEEKKEEAKPEKAKEKKYTEKDLSGLSMDELRAIGEKSKITGRSKKKIIERILKAQEKK